MFFSLDTNFIDHFQNFNFVKTQQKIEFKQKTLNVRSRNDTLMNDTLRQRIVKGVFIY